MPKSDAEQTPPSEKRAEKRAAGRAARRVLVIDDEMLVARSIVRMLGAAYTTTIASSGAEALATLAHDAAFEAVVCDLTMPAMSGVELYREVVRQAPALANRFLFVTGGASDEVDQALAGSAPVPVLEKPFGPELLREAIAQITGSA
jgi:CheY-like chemotaxis protein